MKKIYFLVFPFCFSFLFSFSQTPDWVWARSAWSDSSGFGEGMSVATDQSSNVYIIGTYTDTITFGTHVLTGDSYHHFYLAKYDSSGNVKWAKSEININANAEGFGVGTDASGNCYVSGVFDGTIILGSDTLISIGNYMNIFLIKYDPLGNVLWAKKAGGPDNDFPSSIAVDSWGNIYVTGAFESPSISFGSYVLTNAGAFGTYDIFLAKYDSSGNVLWAKSSGGTDIDEGRGVYIDYSGNAYLTGEFYSASITFGFYTFTNANSGRSKSFLTKYDSSGNVLWAKNYGCNLDVLGNGVAIDTLQNIYVIGAFTCASVSFGSYTLTNTGAYCNYFVKYNPLGNVLWAKGINGSGNANVYCVSTDKYGKIYLTGSFDSPSIIIDTITLQRPTGNNYDPMFIAGFDTSGNVLFAKALASGGDDQNAVAVSSSGSIYVGGDFMRVNPFIVGRDSLPLTCINENVFVAKLSYPQIAENTPEISKDKEIALYPNPATDELIIDGLTPGPSPRERGAGAIIEIYDVLGQKLEVEILSIRGRTTLNIKNLASGVYFLRVTTAERNFVAKFVKE